MNTNQNYFNLLPIVILLTTISSCNNFKLKEGDLLFQDLDSSPLCEAIESVTFGYNNCNISHIGFVVNVNDELKVLEAIPPKVKLTDLDTFLFRSTDSNNNPKVFVGRLDEKFKHLIPVAVDYCLSKLEFNYDEFFLMNNNKYYCSELIYESFKSYNIFKLEKMNFNNLDGRQNKIWENYFDELKMTIPQDSLGINPAVMSKSNNINIIHFYGNLDKKNNTTFTN